MTVNFLFDVTIYMIVFKIQKLFTAQGYHVIENIMVFQ